MFLHADPWKHGRTKADLRRSTDEQKRPNAPARADAVDHEAGRRLQERRHDIEGRQRQAALLAFAAFPELKHVILVDEDVDIFDSDDVLWAMQTRYQGDVDTVMIPGVRCHPLDPSQVPEYSPSVLQQGMSCKTIFDCTVPFHLKHNFERSKFKVVDVKRFLPDFE